MTARAIALIQRFEGLRLAAYRCPAGVWTIGWGHTDGVGEGDSVTRAEADALLRRDVGRLAARVRELTRPRELTANQMAALVSFSYNVGAGNFGRSTLRRMILANPDDPRIAAEFARWRFAGGRELPGLVARRAAEAELYFAKE